ncbi:MAG: thioredoxin family protein [Longimicrobiales bacterium]
MTGDDVVLEVGDETWEQLVNEADLPVILVVSARWWADEVRLREDLDALAERTQERLVVAHADEDSNPRMVRALSVPSVPAAFVFRDGALVESAAGPLPDRRLRGLAERALASAPDRDDATPP